jgi:hypothetical protein
MPCPQPDHVFRRVEFLVRTKAPPPEEHPDDHALYMLLEGRPCPLPTVEAALSLYVDDEARHALSAVILGKASDTQISEAFEIPSTVLVTYRRTFFDRSVFPHVFAIKHFIDTLRASIPADLASLYAHAYERGPLSVLEKYRVGTRPPPDLLAELSENFTYQILNSRAARGQPLTSALAKEALRWAEAACVTANILLRKESTRTPSVEDLRMVLLTRDHAVQVETLQVSGPLLH